MGQLAGALQPMLTRALRAIPIVVIFVAAAALVTIQLWSARAWPATHESGVFAGRTYVYAEHLREGDILPMWSSADNAGFGSPQPGLYHRLFYVVSGAARLTGLPMKGALAVAVVTFLAVGAGGMARLARELGARRDIAISAGLLLLLANYTTTNWLIRGAFAELSAAMLVPWLLWGLVRTARDSSLHLALPIVVGLMIWAHTALAFVVAVLIGTALAIAAVARRISLRALWTRGAAIRVLAGVAIAVPSLATLAVMNQGYDLGRLTPPFFEPRNNFRSPMDYVVDRDWQWGDTARGVTVQLDWPVLLLLGGVVIALVRQRRAARGADAVKPLADTGLWVLTALAGVAALLQLGISGPLYDLVPGLELIQFPWRLLSVLVPTLIALALALLVRLASPERSRHVAIACVFGGVALGGAFAPLDYGRNSLAVDPADLVLDEYGTYVPTAAISTRPPNRARLDEWVRAEGCEVRPLTPAGESTTLTFETTCRDQTIVPLPQFSNDLHRVSVDTADRSVRCARVADWPALCAVELPAGRHEVRLQLASWRVFLRQLLPG